MKKYLYLISVMIIVIILIVSVFIIKNNRDKRKVIDMVYTYTGEGFGGNFTITINKDGTASFYEGALSSYIGQGKWSVKNSILIVSDENYTNRFKILDDELEFIEKGSTNFLYVKVKDREKFKGQSLKNYNLETKEKMTEKENIEEDKDNNIYDYRNPIIPEGFKSVETESASWKLDEEGNPTGWDKGLVIEDDIGNQFVWIPVKDTDNLKRKDGFYANKEQNYVDSCKEADDDNSTVESKELYKSIKKYKGFYIARYEAGIEEQLKTHIQDGTIKPISKQNVHVWNKIRWGSAYGYALDGVQGNDREDGAVKVARSMYPNTEKLKTYYLPNDLTNDTGVISTLCYGVQWDLIMEFLNDIDNPYTKTKYVENSSNMGWYGVTTLQLTGTNLNGNNSNCVKNIYDLAGNIHEWTMESYKDNYRIYRGGVYDAGDKDFSASTRGHCVPDGMGSYMYVGFRVALYLK